MDTIRVRFRGDEGGYDRARGAASGLQRGGELRLVRGGVTVGAFPDGMTYVEGRAAAIMRGRDDHGLVPASELRDAVEAARHFAGVPMEASAGLGRVDVAGELRFEDGREGTALLWAAASVDVPWCRTGTEGAKGSRLETVYWRAARGRRVLLRMYDKGVESGQADRGELIRLERQRFAPKARERSAEDVVSAGLVDLFVGRELAALTLMDHPVTVCGPDSIVAKLREAMDAGRVSQYMGQALAGFVMFGPDGLERSMGYRRAAELRRLGIALDPMGSGSRVVDLASYVRRYVDAVAAAA